MKRFAALLERLVFTASRNGKIRHLQDYLRTTPDPNRGLGLAAIAGTLEIPNVTLAVIRRLVEGRTDPELFRLSYDYVGDLAETAALIWEPRRAAGDTPLRAAVERLQSAGRDEIDAVLADLLDGLDSSGRFALLKLATGGLRVGVSARLVKLALAGFGNRNVDEIEQLWFGLSPPYRELFAWLEGKGRKPAVDRSAVFRPVMPAHPADLADLESLPPQDFVAEWKWDGIRIQAVSLDGRRRLFTRTGEDIGRAFPDVVDTMTWSGVIDGELLIADDGKVRPFDQLQKRLGRKAPSAKLMADMPAHIRAYDLLELPEEDLRPLPLSARRRRLEDWYRRVSPERLDLSEVFAVAGWRELDRLRAACRVTGYEGVMVKRRESPYLSGRVKGHWFKWKRDPLTADCVLMYAQRGHGKRSSYYSDYTFGCWTGDATGRRLVPVGKAYSGYTDEELLRLDRFVRENTVDRFGPVRAVEAALVVEVAFDAVQRSTRHKSGLSMRFPRIRRIRWDKPAGEADTVGTVKALIDPVTANKT